ncbi:MAG: hypothetical protein CO186_11115 [Zetaproteobacteria bacterium CG_4_9_14_3_um_filter_49_83]|nr:MAG: hypothetical protein AUJ56_03445 [Zetaproteobacteria bacterium CG1_02_49_23]PIQ34681.1 MAG: hypothetical protein COW62_00800 [Zetaproteobacteria bacterium CG17_big_fil_post_rev_8_21_14_2_50_50_13]PIV29603.1 MAG: hypothetical protein COS35_11150 [Zetaproteobacteria bacterium CG02_land_8_20_14_3_00_50_9]PIY54976.1 MAG: hypothetical protein COZ00_11710 [Zetaproteobacteria bacterium CG_4_10_14_0_8_um_filter_49_80]PJA34264.1 MAG: hypothetical protein CO186_11115 [Zetaproteobacteria bacterium
MKLVKQNRALQIIGFAATLLLSAYVQAAENNISGLPIAMPEVLRAKFDTAHLNDASGMAMLRYMASQDAQLIRNWLRAEGYLDAVVQAFVENGKARWQVQAGVLWRIRHVEISPPPPESKILLPHSGEAFHSESYEARKNALRWSWRDAGYLQADYSKAIAIPLPQTRQVDIVWQINPEPLFHISDIKIEGAHQYTPDLAIKISRLRATQVPTQDRLQAATQYVLDDPRYQSVMIVPQLSQIDDDQVPVRIIVTESGWKKLTGDVGYSSDSGLGLGILWVDRSLQDGQFEYTLRGAATRTSSGVGTTLLRPTWPAANQKTGLNLDYNRVDNDGRSYEAISGGPFWQVDFGNSDYLRTSLYAEQVREAGLSVLTLGPRVDLHFAHENGGLIPVSGWRMDTGVGIPQRINASGLWLVMDMRGRYFYQPADWLLLAPRAGVGRTVNLQGSVPKTYRQFAGGATTARGYALDSLGPVDNTGLATGGLMRTFAGLDLLLMPHAETFSPVLFFDTAKVWQTVGLAAPTVNSAGIGGIMRTPAGPLRLDIALPLNRRPQDSRYQLYIMLGELF